MERPNDALRPVTITPDWSAAPLASVFIEWGHTRVLCTAIVEDDVPPFRVDRGGWLTAEYGMLPGSSPRSRSPSPPRRTSAPRPGRPPAP